jgi:hypothetical protein
MQWADFSFQLLSMAPRPEAKTERAFLRATASRWRPATAMLAPLSVQFPFLQFTPKVSILTNQLANHALKFPLGLSCSERWCSAVWRQRTSCLGYIPHCLQKDPKSVRLRAAAWIAAASLSAALQCSGPLPLVDTKVSGAKSG